MNIIQTAGKKGAFLAPLAGISNLPFRLIARSLGCALAYTEMISANGLVRKTAKTFEYLKTCADDHLLGAQVFGADPEIVAQASRIIADNGADLIDINMGCPVRDVVKKGAGAGLIGSYDLSEKIIRAVKDGSGGLPVSVKTRLGKNENVAKDWASFNAALDSSTWPSAPSVKPRLYHASVCWGPSLTASLNASTALEN